MSEPVGVVLIGHGETASALMAAARGVVGDHALEDVLVVDAGVGSTPELRAQICELVSRADRGAGVVLMTDLWGGSPCECSRQEANGHKFALVSGANLGMLVKLAGLDRLGTTPDDIARACAGAASRAVRVSLTTGDEFDMSDAPNAGEGQT